MKTFIILANLMLMLLFAGTSHGFQKNALEWKFKVFLDDREIGFHDFTVVRDNEMTKVDIDARFDVKVLFFTAYKYRHQNAETYNNDCLSSVDASTNDNGDKKTVSGDRRSDAFAITNADGQTDLLTDPCLMSFAYWHPSMLEATQLINTQTGDIEPVTVSALGDDTVLYQDRMVPAQQYALNVQGQKIRLWYDAENYRWLALEAPAKGGRVLRYEPISVPSDVALLTNTHSVDS